MTAENGLQAVQIVSSKPTDFFDAIVLDVNMPIMDGLEACLLIDQNLGHRCQPNLCMTLIYALTADKSDEMARMIKMYPFDC